MFEGVARMQLQVIRCISVRGNASQLWALPSLNIMSDCTSQSWCTLNVTVETAFACFCHNYVNITCAPKNKSLTHFFFLLLECAASAPYIMLQAVCIHLGHTASSWQWALNFDLLAVTHATYLTLCRGLWVRMARTACLVCILKKCNQTIKMTSWYSWHAAFHIPRTGTY